MDNPVPVRPNASLMLEALSDVMTATFRWNRDSLGSQVDAKQALEDLQTATNKMAYAQELMRRETARIRETQMLNDRADGKIQNDTERLMRQGKGFTPGKRR
jgi:hypothetical protein